MKPRPLLDRLTTGLDRLPERYLNAALLILILGIFFALNKAAYQSYFSDDDLSNLAIFETWWSLIKDNFTAALIPVFRPFGAVYYKAMGPIAGLHFAAYVATLQTFHVATGLLLWLFLRRLNFPPVPAAAGAAFFILHMSTLPAYWKPMYVFDILCGLWVILSLLFYQRGRFLLSFLCAWLAFKSKEMELMLPLALLAYEWLIARELNPANSEIPAIKGNQIRWKPLIPFFLMSLSFGLQSLMMPKGPETGYTMHLNAATIWSGAAYYGGKLLYAPLSGLIVSIGLLILRKPIVTWGVLGFWIMIAPMFGFPARESGAYLYVPMLLFAGAVAGIVQWKPWWAALFALIWIPASYDQLREQRKPLIAYHYDHLPYVTQIVDSLAHHPQPPAVVYDGTPTDFNTWGQEGLFRFVTQCYDLPVLSAWAPDAQAAIRRPGALLFTWDDLHRQVFTDSFPGENHEPSHVDFGKQNPIWLLKSGWMPLSADCRFTAPRASITLHQPGGDLDFAITVYLSPEQTKLHPLLKVLAGGDPIGQHMFDTTGLQSFRWQVPTHADATPTVEFLTDPPFHLPDSDPLGMRICQCGFVPR